jgi:hypothetical protein
MTTPTPYQGHGGADPGAHTDPYVPGRPVVPAQPAPQAPPPAPFPATFPAPFPEPAPGSQTARATRRSRKAQRSEQPRQARDTRGAREVRTPRQDRVVPPAPPVYEPDRRSRRTRRHLVGYPLTALVALASGIGVGIGAAGSGAPGGDDRTGVTNTAATSSPSRSGDGPAASPRGGSGVGKPYRDGKFQFTVTRVRSGVRKIGGGTGAKPTGQFVLVSVTIRNLGDRPQTLHGDNQTLYDADGRAYTAATAAAKRLKGSGGLGKELGPAASLKAVIVFDVPRGVRPSRLLLHDTLFSGGVEVPLE